MLRFLPYVLKTLWRHRARTVLTAAGAAVAMFVFCFVGAIQQGMDELRQRQQAKGALVVFQANKFCPATSHLPQDYQNKMSEMSGVREVVPIQAFTNNCRASLDVVVFYGLPAEQLRRVRDFELTGGSWDEFERHQDAAMVGSAVAGRRQIGLGDKFSIGHITAIHDHGFGTVLLLDSKKFVGDIFQGFIPGDTLIFAFSALTNALHGILNAIGIVDHLQSRSTFGTQHT